MIKAAARFSFSSTSVDKSVRSTEIKILISAAFSAHVQLNLLLPLFLLCFFCGFFTAESSCSVLRGGVSSCLSKLCSFLNSGTVTDCVNLAVFGRVRFPHLPPLVTDRRFPFTGEARASPQRRLDCLMPPALQSAVCLTVKINSLGDFPDQELGRFSLFCSDGFIRR